MFVRYSTVLFHGSHDLCDILRTLLIINRVTRQVFHVPLPWEMRNRLPTVFVGKSSPLESWIIMVMDLGIFQAEHSFDIISFIQHIVTFCIAYIYTHNHTVHHPAQALITRFGILIR